MADSAAYSPLVPGFDFLQNLMKGASAGMPTLNQWIAPTLDPDELDKRIQELKTVQFWLDQNARLLGTTVQALEVQRMTLSTLKTMNLPLADLRDAMTLRAAPKPEAAAEPAAKPVRASAAESGAAAGPVDPMQWWTALTQQFGELAANAMKDMPRAPGAASAPSASTPGADPAAAPATASRRAPARKRARPDRTDR